MGLHHPLRVVCGHHRVRAGQEGRAVRETAHPQVQPHHVPRRGGGIGDRERGEGRGNRIRARGRRPI